MTTEQYAAGKHEIDEHAPSAYEQSVQQLMNLLDDTQVDRTNAWYFRADWDHDEPTRLIRTTKMYAEPTGARRQEQFNEFHQAQLYIMEAPTDGEVVHRFIWCATTPQRPGTSIEIDASALRQQHGYEKLDTTNVALVLLENAVSTDDCAALIRALEGRECAIGKPLSQKVNKFTSRLMHHDFDHDDPDSIARAASKVFELLHHCQAFGQDVPRQTQGYLTTHLLRVIANHNTTSNLTPDKAMEVMESAITQGVISNPHVMKRILGATAIYRYPYATHLLHAYFQTKNSNRGPRNIFDIGRVRFATEYIVAQLHSHEARLSTPLRHFLRTVNSSQMNQQDLFTTLKELVSRTGGPNKAAEADELSGISAMFEHVLCNLRGGNVNADQVFFDKKCVEIVQSILAPEATRRLGEHALLDADELEAW